MLTEYLSAFAVSDPAARRAAVQEALHKEGFAPFVQTAKPTVKNPRGVENYLLLPDTDAPCPMVCAHYDAYPGSSGANDNAAALCILLALAKELRARGVSAVFAFLDAEETGHLGAKLCRDALGQAPSYVVNLDMCGYGDVPVVYARGAKRGPAHGFFDKPLAKQHGARLVKFLPESDDRVFSSRRQPVVSLAVLPQWDVPYLDALASYGDHILGRPPEFEMMLEQMEITSTMHGALRDGVEWIQPQAMQRLYDYALAALTAPPLKKLFAFRYKAQQNMKE